MTTTFATLAIPPFWQKETMLLVKTLRKFGGPFADSSVLVLTRQEKPLSSRSMKQFEDLNVVWGKFRIEEEAENFPLSVVPFAAAAAEQNLAGKADQLIWLLPDTLILNPPVDFSLNKTHRLAYRPVHHKNIGSDFNKPPDDFWQKIYQHCNVPEAHLFNMETCYRETVRPYFNAGILGTRPEDGVMSAWLDTFQRTYRHPDFVPFFKTRKYALFMHQAVLSGAIMNKYLPDQITELAESYNYPLHMHKKYPQQGRAESLNQLITVRYEKTRLLPKFLSQIQVDPPLSDWLKEQALLP